MIGMWLGTENRIIALEFRLSARWVARDSTGAHYYQRDEPEGLSLSATPDGEKVLIPWPAELTL